MCVQCTADATYQNNINRWALDGLPYSKMSVLVRDRAVTYPNTFVFVFKDAAIFNGIRRTVKVDVHYYGNRIEPGRKLQAFGGLWITGFNGAMKPQQHGGAILEQLSIEIPTLAPSGGISAVYGDRYGNQPLPHGLRREKIYINNGLMG
ncbi:hypothetical protein ACJJJB_20640 [Microbulbifer sp. ANSA001]|uniref:hypothetical protein n=1 Tax=Microbulbifer sp. ANSA001 TaxID=3243358 RepID=UPI0040421223